MGLRARLSDHLTLVHLSQEDLHFSMHCGYKSCLQSIFAQSARQVSDSGAAYHSDIDVQLGTHESTVQQNVHSILTIIDRSL